MKHPLKLVLSAGLGIMISCTSASADSVTFTIGAKNGVIRSLRGINIGPLSSGNPSTNADLTTAYHQLGIDLIRTHDYYGPLDMATMYPDRSKDPNVSTNYNFTGIVNSDGRSSDEVFAAIVNNGFEPFFRIGDSYNNSTPPTDSQLNNWVQASVNVLKHYRQGQWNGFNNSFRYVEVWNEPDNEQFWPKPATPMQFLKLYDQTSKAIKTAFPEIKIGGPGVTQNGCKTDTGKAWLDAFLDYVKQQGSPLDYFSWHMYSNSPEDYANCAAYYRKELDERGFTSMPLINSEWNTDAEYQNITNAEKMELRTGAKGAAVITGTWINMQQRDDIAQSLFYRGPDPAMDAPFFYGIYYANGQPKKNALAWELWQDMGQYPFRLAITGGKTGLYALAGKDANGALGMLLANPSVSSVQWRPELPESKLMSDYKVVTRVVTDSSDTIASATVTGTDITLPSKSVQFVFFTPESQTFSAQGSTSGTNEHFTLTAQLKVNATDVGKDGRIYLAALAGSNWYFNDGVKWTAWTEGDLPAWYSGALSASFTLPVLQENDVTGLTGVSVFVGYGLSVEDMLARKLYMQIHQF